jgi:hypothetical protein
MVFFGNDSMAKNRRLHRTHQTHAGVPLYINPNKIWLLAFLITLLVCFSPFFDCISVSELDYKDFNNGTFENVQLNNHNIILDYNRSIPEGWTKTAEWYPTARHDHAMAFDPEHGEAIMFGGRNIDNYLTDTCIFNLSNSCWNSYSSYPSPYHGWGPGLAYDSNNHVVIEFGGWGNYNRQSNETWVFDTNKHKWTNNNPVNPPSNRRSHSMVYDPINHATILFGGMAGGPVGDLWIYKTETNHWTELHPINPPTARLEHAMTFDTKRNQAIMFAGTADILPWITTITNDLWSFNLTKNSWTDLTPIISPSPRRNPSITYDKEADRIILFGGSNHQTTVNETTLFNDTWIYDIENNTWLQITPAIGPSARVASTMIYDDIHNVTLLFGGDNETGCLDDTWIFDSTLLEWKKVDSPQFPHPRVLYSSIFNSRNNQIMIFGGGDGESHLDDSWILDIEKGKWTKIESDKSPERRLYESFVYIPTRNVGVFFGGSTAYGYKTDTWIFNFNNSKWQEMNPTTSPSAGNKMVYDSLNDKVILIGGASIKNETWIYDMERNDWRNMNPSDSPIIGGEISLSFDSKHGVVVLFGSGVNGNETWIYKFSTNTWQQMHPLTSPPSSIMGSMVYYTDVGLHYLYIGGAFSDYKSEFWSYDLMNDKWQQKDTINSTRPRTQTNIIYNSLDKTIHLMYGYSWDPLIQSWQVKNDILSFNAFSYIMNGCFTSEPIDLGRAANFGKIGWKGYQPTGTMIKYQIRAGDTMENLSFADYIGWDGTPASYYEENGQRLSSIFNGKRWIQYVAFLETNQTEKSPQITNITITYNLYPDISIQTPAGSENWTGTQTIRWICEDMDNDSILMDIYLENQTFITVIASNLSNNEKSIVWNTTDFENGFYHIKIVARDENPEIPVVVTEISDNFQISNYFFNNPPMISSHPVEYAMAGKIYYYNITAEDKDGDLLNYELVSSPSGMTIDRMTSLIRWIPEPEQSGPHTVFIRVSDGKRGLCYQSYNLTVLNDTTYIPPECIIIMPVNGSRITGPFTISGKASGRYFNITEVDIRLDGKNWYVAEGQSNWIFILNSKDYSNGDHIIEARALDSYGVSNSARILIRISNTEAENEKRVYFEYSIIVGIIIIIVVLVAISVAYRLKKGK